ncbi:hypothetical protein ACFE04_013984 [Oxalis oulophora]
MSSSSSTVDDKFRSPLLAVSGGDQDDTSSSPPLVATSSREFRFSSGNPRIEETRGLMHLFSDTTTSNLPVGRKPLLCVLGIPNHMTYSDFCQFCASFVHHISEMRIVRNDEMEDRYSILIRFDSQDSTDRFYQHFKEKPYNSLEEEICRVLFTVDVQFTGYSGSIEHVQSNPASLTEQPSCPVCLERLDQDTSGTLTTICNHSFHISCISNWTDSSCPVCRYCQQQPEKSICFVCQTSENLWICVLCGFVGCGRYKGEHAVKHWKETQHCYSLELETQRVWDYVGDNYVHRLIQSKTDGKLVELNSHCLHANGSCGSCDCSKSGISDTLFDSKVEEIANEYNELLAPQLDNQRSYFEALLQDVKDQTEREISEAVNKAVTQRLAKMQAKLDRCIKEKKFLDDLNENLEKNQEIWKAKILESEEREMNNLKAKDDKIEELEKQLQDLMACLEEGRATEQLPVSEEIKDGTVLKLAAGSSSKTKSNGRQKGANRKKSG